MSIVVIAAGGTGGHIQPGLACGRALASGGSQVSYIGTARGLETLLIPDAGFSLQLINMIPMSRSAGWKLIFFPIYLLRASLQARRILKDRRADVALSMGGYVGMPVIIGARLARIPAVVHESGAIPGRANIWSARICRRAGLAFAAAGRWFSKRIETRVVGMPIADEIANLDRSAERNAARRNYQISDGVFCVMVNGGSQGSVRLNDLVVGLAARWANRDDVKIIAKTGRDRLANVQKRIDAVGGSNVVSLCEYFENMSTAYGAADVAICRAGASTIAELAAIELPAVLVPYPYAPMDHQAHNASVLSDVGAAVMVRDENADAQHIGPIVEMWIADPEKLAKMAVSSSGIAIADAAERMANWIEELAK